MITTFDQYNKSVYEIDTFEKKMCKLIDEWLELNFPNLNGKCFKFTKVDLKQYPEAKEMNQYFHINFSGGNYMSLTKEKYEDLLNFIENPEIYKNAKKYNL